MEEDVQQYFERGLAPSTRKTYQGGINKFVKFCALYNISSLLPVSQSLLCSYISHLANSGLAYGTIKTYLAAIRYLQISQDFPDEDLCPVVTLLAYLAVRGMEPGPLLKLSDGRFLTKQIFITRVRPALSVLGYDCSSYAGHSFRIGAATTPAECGIEDLLIKILG